MAAQRDYYEVLGVARGASDAEVKKAFRQLARELHPDVSDAPDAEARFKEVAEAYEVLSDGERRQLYDRFGHDGLRSGGFQPGSTFDFGSLGDIFSAFFGEDVFGGGRGGRRARRGADVVSEVEVTLADAAGGVTHTIAFEAAAACASCQGSGAAPGTSRTSCTHCRGSGRVQQVTESAFGRFMRTAACPRCNGAGTLIESPCPECQAAGRVLAERRLDVDVPPGIHDGQRIRISGEGHAGADGGPPGDVYVLVHVAEDERFVRDGDDIYASVTLTITEAALGTKVSVPTLDGETEIDFPAGTQPGDRHLLRGAGMPVLQGRGRGDQHVLVSVAVPRRLTDEQRRLLEQFAAGADARTYEADESLLGRLKSAFR